MVSASQDTYCRKHVITKDIVHGLIGLALRSLDAEPKQIAFGAPEEDKEYIKESVRALYNLASFDRVKCYIPGESVALVRGREKFILWGGLLALYQISSRAQLEGVQKFCEHTHLHDMEPTDLDQVASTLRLYIEAKTKKGPDDPVFPEYEIVPHLGVDRSKGTSTGHSCCKR